MKRPNIEEILGTMGLMRKSNAGGVGSFLFGLGVGIAGGCAAAFLLTPYSGPEARQKLARASEDLSKQVQGKVEEITKNFQKSDLSGSTPGSYAQIGKTSTTRVGI